MMANYLDNFVDPDGTLLGDHTADSGHKYETTPDLEIQNNRLWNTNTGSGTDSLVLEADGVTPYVTSAEFDIESEFYNGGTAGQIRMSFCSSSAGYYILTYYLGEILLQQWTVSTSTFSTHRQVAAVSGDAVKVEVRETTLELFKNGIGQGGPLTNTDFARTGNVEFAAGNGSGSSDGFRFPYMSITDFAATPVTRKGSTFDIETTLGTITTATLNGVNVFDHVTGQVGTTVSFAGAATDEITTSGEYTLALGDGTGAENITLQVNVVGLPIYNLNKDGADLASLTDVEVIVMTGAAGSRAVSQNTASRTTTASGDTTAYEVTDLALTVDQNVFVVVSSAASGVGVAFTDTLELM